MEYVDLHTHSTASDGTETPEALVRAAAACGLKAVALTDHDTAAGLDEAEAAGHACGIRVVRGCELAARTPYGEAHILGLWLPRDLGRLGSALEALREKRALRNMRMVEKLCGLGLDISCEEVLREAGEGSVGRPHMAAVLVRKGYAHSVREAFARYLGYGGAAFVEREVLEPAQAVQLLCEAGATAVLAHPCLLPCPRDWLEGFVRELAGAGLTGLEAYHSEHDAAQTRQCVELAGKYGLELSGGSDFHGGNKPGIRLGVGRGGLRVPAFVLERLLARRARLGLPA
ncbi:MAG: PHP domain-containing protein [Desulfovibrionaceae bacterium]|nr:PHP domain-containing protein [Desulfovibrionaceae bacterium]